MLLLDLSMSYKVYTMCYYGNKVNVVYARAVLL